MRTGKGNIYFISDMHLGANYLPDKRAAEMRVVRFLDSIKADASKLFLMGDVLDYWYEYRYVVPRGYVRFLGKLAELVDAGVEVYWFTGNHDVWLFDYVRDEIGVKVVKRYCEMELGGKRFFLSHGDDVGRRPASFKFLRSIFHSRFCQVLYASIHPRWTVGFAMGWSSKNRTTRKEEKALKTAQECVNNLVEYATQYVASHNVDYFVFGHAHLPQTHILPSGETVMVLGEWISQFAYAVFDGEKLTLETFAQE
ncbi:MAG: UDP-2,3-diacylglucosamine diphosphatase [Muribaculaceae bacterium]|nr:UDP-2,3-diacylglucosamine diphosphatase [Muribaculaceae bacterium]